MRRLITAAMEKTFRAEYKARTGSIKNARKAWIRKSESLGKQFRRSRRNAKSSS